MTVAWVFPGQGSQTVGMGRDVWEQSPAARARFAEADDVLGFSLSALCFHGPPEVLTRTENAQPALLTVSAALLDALGWRPGQADGPQFMAGHSLGEYTALYAAGAFDFATAIQLVRRRGELMAAATEGSMAAVLGLDAAPLEEVCAAARVLGPVVIANENAPGQLVISGASAAVARVAELAKGAGAKRVVPLNVSAAFHSPLMAEVAAEMALVLAQATIMPAQTPVISNVTAQPLLAPDAIRAELVAQITGPVKWIDSVGYMAAQGVTHMIEIGPEKVLTGLIKRIAPGVTLHNVANSLSLAALERGQA